MIMMLTMMKFDSMMYALSRGDINIIIFDVQEQKSLFCACHHLLHVIAQTCC
jgi:hypothetical protein